MAGEMAKKKRPVFLANSIHHEHYVIFFSPRSIEIWIWLEGKQIFKYSFKLSGIKHTNYYLTIHSLNQ